jgi:folate-binding protein YgfZ
MDTILPNRGVLAISGDDRVAFLQGLVTNDVTKASETIALYACFLNAQGRFLHDFFIVAEGQRLLLECEGERRGDLLKRLTLYRLKSRVEIVDESDMFTASAIIPFPDGRGRPATRRAGEGQLIEDYPHPPVPDGTGPSLSHRGEGLIYDDPRSPALGRRMLSLVQAPKAVSDFHPAFVEYDRLRISLGIPDGSRDMVPGESLPMENNIDLLHGIAWDKGCYVGQEVTARMRYRGQAKKRLTPVRLKGPAPATGTVLYEGGRDIGEMRSSCGDMGLALLRVDAGANTFQWGETQLTIA